MLAFREVRGFGIRRCLANTNKYVLSACPKTHGEVLSLKGRWNPLTLKLAADPERDLERRIKI